MFVQEEVKLAIALEAAQARLEQLLHDNSLLTVSKETYGEGITGLLRVGPVGTVPGLSRLVEVNFRDLVKHDGYAVLTLRWRATGPSGGLFPVLDADLTLTADGMEATRLRLDGVYRPPLGAAGAGLDRAIMHRLAAATMRGFLGRLAADISQQSSAAP